MLTATLKPKHCSMCQTLFSPRTALQTVCGPSCAIKKVKGERALEKAQTKRRKAALKTIPELIKEAQKEFNAYIRERDRAQPCICCGRMETSVTGLYSHGWDCGHFRSTGSASHLRFNEDNAHRQLVWCNRYGAGRAVDYRRGLICRIGEPRVLSLENDNQSHKWERDELIAIKATYVRKLKELKASQNEKELP